MSLKGAFAKAQENDWRWIELEDGFSVYGRFVSDQKMRKLANRVSTTSIRKNRESYDTDGFLREFLEYAVKDWQVTYGMLNEVVDLDDEFLKKHGEDSEVPFSHENLFDVCQGSSRFTDALMTALRAASNFLDIPVNEEEELGPDPTNS